MKGSSRKLMNFSFHMLICFCLLLFLGKLQNVENAVREENKLSQEEKSEVRGTV